MTGGLLADPAGVVLDGDEIRRYSRHLLLPEIGDIGQRRLKSAKVLVVGAGGLGSPALMYLAAAGVGTLGIIDFDVVEESNLQRQIIHEQGDIGRSKVHSARDTVRRINPRTNVVAHNQRLAAGNALDILSPYDLVVDGSDNFSTRYLINDGCVMLGKPYVWGSVVGFSGQVSAFWAGHGPCYRCVFPEPAAPRDSPSCAEAGVLGVVCGLIGSWQALEAIKLLTDIGSPLIGSMLLFDGLRFGARRLSVRPDPECAVCGSQPTVTRLHDDASVCRSAAESEQPEDPGTISAPELAALLERRRRGERDFVLVDVREPAEHEIDGLAGSIVLPLRRFTDGSAGEALPPGLSVILYCSTGIRSASALTSLRRAGRVGAVHLDGGLISLAEHQRPDLRRSGLR